MNESFNTETTSPQHSLFTLVLGCVVLSILLTGATVLVARLIPFT
jgi:hypothetical protein